LARCIKRSVHSRSWLTLPGDDSRSRRKTLWIESTTRTAGLLRSAASRMAARSFSAEKSRSFDSRPRRRARIPTWASDSSPETYRTGPAASAARLATCISSVDLPTPGSPPIRTSEPRTIPPPSTRLNSGSGSSSRSKSAASISLRRSARAGPLAAGAVRTARPPAWPASRLSSRVFQPPHSAHRPIHFGERPPHC
jgi:hypothetical protein